MPSPTSRGVKRQAQVIDGDRYQEGEQRAEWDPKPPLMVAYTRCERSRQAYIENWEKKREERPRNVAGYNSFRTFIGNHNHDFFSQDNWILYAASLRCTREKQYLRRACSFAKIETEPRLPVKRTQNLSTQGPKFNLSKQSWNNCASQMINMIDQNVSEFQLELFWWI